MWKRDKTAKLLAMILCASSLIQSAYSWDLPNLGELGKVQKPIKNNQLLLGKRASIDEGVKLAKIFMNHIDNYISGNKSAAKVAYSMLSQQSSSRYTLSQFTELLDRMSREVGGASYSNSLVNARLEESLLKNVSPGNNKGVESYSLTFRKATRKGAVLFDITIDYSAFQDWKISSFRVVPSSY